MSVKKLLKKFIPKSYFERRDQKVLAERKKIQLQQWIDNGKPVPPPHIVKEQLIETLGKKGNYTVFVETGTHKGEMVVSQASNFQSIYSIELNDALYQFNCEQFKKQNHIHLVKGDSGIKLPEIVEKLTSPALFWLDGHFDFTPETSKGELITPINKELIAIAKSDFNHLILIDDARLFNGTNDYPTIEDLKATISRLFKDVEITIESDVIVIQKK